MKKIVRIVAGTALAASTVAASAVAAGTAAASTGAVHVGTAAQHASGVRYADGERRRSIPVATVRTSRVRFAVRGVFGETLPVDSGRQAPATGVAATTSVGRVRQSTRNEIGASGSRVGTHATSASEVDASAKPVDRAADFEAALGAAATNFGVAAGVGGMVGGVAGALVGCPLGVVTGGTLTAPTVVATPLGVVGGCLLGAGIVGSVGSIVGGAVVGIPVGLASVVQMYNTLHAQGDV